MMGKKEGGEGGTGRGSKGRKEKEGKEFRFNKLDHKERIWSKLMLSLSVGVEFLKTLLTKLCLGLALSL